MDEQLLISFIKKTKMQKVNYFRRNWDFTKDTTYKIVFINKVIVIDFEKNEWAQW